MDTEKLANLITELRNKKGWTQQELADKLNVSNKLISKWENGGAVPDVCYLENYSKIFNVTIDSLVGNDHNLKLAIDYEKVTVDKKIKKSSYIAPIICGIVFILYIAGVFISAFIVPNKDFPIWAKILVGIVPSAFMLATFTVMIQRIKEIKGGDENDSSKY
ncbi:MAG: helix-turn-helix transcriptional regulator [Clostridia bacterium]